ncbi:hypothetical protein FACS1894153_2080 [Bacteroidia bacterium]|nr:hypothetical protein FACS1894153_2080 [Bacteroidia bacterium]
MKKFLLLSICFTLFLGLQSQDVFNGLQGRAVMKPNIAIIGDEDIKIRLTIAGKENNFVLVKSEMFDYYYDTAHPLGQVRFVNLQDTAEIFALASKYVYGKYDANKNYKMYMPSALTTFVLSAIPYAGAILGLAYGVPSALTTPKINHLGHPDIVLVEDRLYYKGYADRARRIKAQKIWLSYGLGLAVCIGAIWANETFDVVPALKIFK